jgi:hypothetical protein
VGSGSINFGADILRCRVKLNPNLIMIRTMAGFRDKRAGFAGHRLQIIESGSGNFRTQRALSMRPSS